MNPHAAAALMFLLAPWSAEASAFDRPAAGRCSPYERRRKYRRGTKPKAPATADKRAAAKARRRAVKAARARRT